MPADRAGDATSRGVTDFTRHTASLVRVGGIGNLARNAGGDSPSLGFLNPVARRAGDSSRADLLSHRASRVRNPAGADLLNHLASPIGNPTGADLLCHRASRVRNLAMNDLLLHVADLVGDLTGHRLRNLAADRVRNPACLGFLNPAGAVHGNLFGAGAPDLTAADRRGALTAFDSAWSRPVAAAAGAGVEFPAAGLLNADLVGFAGDRLRFGLPFAGADRFVSRLGNRTANGLADVFVARFGDVLERRAGHVTIHRLVNWATDGV